MVTELSLPQAEPTSAAKKKSKVAPVAALILVGCGAVGAFGYARWTQAHREIPAASASIVADVVDVKAPLPGTVQQLLVKPGQAVKSGDLVAVVMDPDLVKRYQQAESEMEHAKKLDVKTEASILPPHIEGNLLPTPPPVDLSSLKPLPTAGPIPGTAPAASASHGPATQKAVKLQGDVADAEKMVSQCTDTLQAMQADVDAAQSVTQSQSLPIDDLKSAVEMAKSKRDKFQGLYNDGIISRAEFQQKQADLDTAQANLDQANQTVGSLQSKAKTKLDDLDLAKKALDAAKANLAKQQGLLAKAQAAAKTEVASQPVQPIQKVSPIPISPFARQRFKMPRFSMPAPKVAPLNVLFSPVQHNEAENEVTAASRNLQMLSDQLKACRIVASADGSVVTTSVHEGQAVDPKTPILEIVRPGTQRIVANFSHADALRIRYGQKCSVSFDFLPHRKFQGTVARFLDSGDKTRPASLEIALIDPANTLATIPLDTITHVSVLPR